MTHTIEGEHESNLDQQPEADSVAQLLRLAKSLQVLESLARPEQGEAKPPNNPHIGGTNDKYWLDSEDTNW